MTTQLHQPFTKHTLNTFIQKLGSIIKSGECGSVLNLARRDQLYRVKQLKEHHVLIQKYLNKHKKSKIVFLDLSTEMIEDAKDLKIYLKSHVENNIRMVIFILDADKLLFENKGVLSYLDNLHHENPLISFIYLFQKNMLLPKFTKKFASFSTLYQNIHIFPLFERKDTEEFMIQMSQRFDTVFPIKIKEQILNICGGNLWLIKQACRQYAQTQDISTLFESEGMQTRLHVIHNEFEPEEKAVLKKIALHQDVSSPDETSIIRYFTTNRFIQKNKNRYVISIPILDRFILDQQNRRHNIKLNERDQITINEVAIDNILSHREKKLLKFFIQHPNTVVPRDKVAHVFWGDNSQEQYTDWALDQIIRRLRIKFEKLGLKPKLLQTIKNQGYSFM